ncbi:SirB2 family protein [Kistimonas asteriae]|uniref:SirB2 family protein n=1 Tax=Kistimonas asteriae TaxID=517724 RepID=UPI001BA5E179|nr:SirB2 family protein [Kistimonas asteriae]
MYLIVKHLHMTLALLSVGLFSVRACWSVAGSARLQQRWVRIVPHLLDTLLLGCGVWLAWQWSAWDVPWVQAKLAALFVYIGLGMVAIKRGKTPRVRAVAALISIAVFVYILSVAVTKSPLPFMGM